MKAEIFSTGDEIRSGALIDSNTAYIAEKLEENGIEVMRHISCGDDLQVLVEIIREIGGRADIAVVTGGLGPTTDDLTSEAAAKAAGVKLVLDQESLTHIRAMFKKFNRPMSPSNEKQAMFPEGSSVLKNPAGTAPGFSIKIGKCTFFFMPGVPFEMKKMLSDHVLPALLQLQEGIRKYSIVRTITTFGLGESIVGEKVADIVNEFKDIKLGLRATFPEIHVKLYLRGEDEKKMNETLGYAVNRIVDRIGPNIISINGNPMEKAVGELLGTKSATLAIAESCTGGLIADLITGVSGSSDYFLFSGVTYSNESKIKILGVNPETLKQHGAVSIETAREMAEGARRVSGADYAVSTSGIAGPDGGSEEKPVGTVCIGLAAPHGSTAKKWTSPYGNLSASYGSRERNKRWFAMMALEMLRRELLGMAL
ncbi:MAG: competence/damage-inducible protein A [Spirochaetes bacterium]|nr:competence/damage-inducible protein A [Spirochaetota bacterium]